VWSWWHEGSVHPTGSPTVDEVAAPGEPVDPRMLGAVGAALATVRKSKSEAKLSMRAEVARITLGGPEALLDHVRAGEADLRSAGKVTGPLDLVAADAWSASDVELIPVEKPKPQTQL
jgi:valyl-tRNA synthetase